MKNPLPRAIFTPCLLFLIFSFGCEKKEPRQEAPPPAVSVTHAVTQDVVSSMLYVGQVVAYDDVNLAARVEGFLTQRNFDEGQAVKEGDILFTIEKDQYIASVNASKAALAQKKAEQVKANQDFLRYKTLVKENAVATKQFEDAAASKAIADANVLAAEADLQKANLNLSYTDIKAPFSGRVGFANYSVGNLVGPSSKYLANVVKMDPVKVDFSISEIFVASTLEQCAKEKNERPEALYTPKLLLSTGDEYPFPGKIAFWNNKIDAATGTLSIRATFPNPGQLLIPGGYVKVKIEGSKPQKSVMIPASSIQEDQTGKFVIVVKSDNTAEKRNIKTGDKIGLNMVVKSGLAEGETVVTEGLQKVRHGAKVTPTADKAFNPPRPPADLINPVK